MKWLYYSCVSKIFMQLYNVDSQILWFSNSLHHEPCSDILVKYSFHELTVLLSIKCSGFSLKYWIAICLIQKWLPWSPYNWCETAPKKNSHLHNPSWHKRKLNSMVEPNDNWLCLYVSSGPGFNSMSPDVKSFILDTQNLLVPLPVCFVLCLGTCEHGLLVCLLLCSILLPINPFKFRKLAKKPRHICYILHTKTYIR